MTVTADDQTRLYGQANSTFTYTLSGFVNGENETSPGVSGSPVLGTTATMNSPVSASPYPITVAVGSLSAANYDFPSLVRTSPWTE